VCVGLCWWLESGGQSVSQGSGEKKVVRGLRAQANGRYSQHCLAPCQPPKIQRKFTESTDPFRLNIVLKLLTASAIIHRSFTHSLQLSLTFLFRLLSTKESVRLYGYAYCTLRSVHMSSGGKIIGTRPPKAFIAEWRKSYLTFWPDRIMHDPYHPLHLRRMRYHKEKEQTGLWWWIQGGFSISKKSVVRHWLWRRLNTALVEELKAKGFDRNGKSIPGIRGEGAPDLFGSLKLAVQRPLLTIKFEELKMQTGLVIQAIEREAELSRQEKRLEANMGEFAGDAVGQRAKVPEVAKWQRGSKTSHWRNNPNKNRSKASGTFRKLNFRSKTRLTKQPNPAHMSRLLS